MLKSLALIATFALGMCGQPEPIALTPPASLLTCADEPTAPDLPTRDGTIGTELLRDRAVLEYVLALRTAGGDCRAKVAGVRAWSETVAD